MINLSLASYPNTKVLDAMALSSNAKDPVLGKIENEHVQICPQNCLSKFDDESLRILYEQYPDVNFRLHANVKIMDKHVNNVDLAQFNKNKPYFLKLKELNDNMKAEAYTIHAGRRLCPLSLLFKKLQDLEDMLGIPIGVEGMYPTGKDTFLLQDYKEYQALLDSGMKYALDLSHLNIVRTHYGANDNLVTELLSSENCIEVHLSHNNGISDSHELMIDKNVWWLDLLKHKHENSVIFYEGNLLKHGN